jgi:hypothetical protein
MVELLFSFTKKARNIFIPSRLISIFVMAILAYVAQVVKEKA